MKTFKDMINWLNRHKEKQEPPPQASAPPPERERQVHTFPLSLGSFEAHPKRHGTRSVKGAFGKCHNRP